MLIVFSFGVIFFHRVLVLGRQSKYQDSAEENNSANKRKNDFGPCWGQRSRPR